MDLMGMEALARFWGSRGLLDSPAAFGLVDYCMELMRRHFIMKEGELFSGRLRKTGKFCFPAGKSGWSWWARRTSSPVWTDGTGLFAAFCWITPAGAIFSLCPAFPPDVVPQGTPGAYYTLKKAPDEVKRGNSSPFPVVPVPHGVCGKAECLPASYRPV